MSLRSNTYAIAVAAAALHDKAWYDRMFDALPRVAELLTALVAALGLAGLARGIFRSTLGRRRDRYARLARLGTNAQLSFFTSVLGEPPAVRRTVDGQVTRFDDDGGRHADPASFIEATYIDRDFYVHAIADFDETVHAYSVTTRSKRFQPRFRPPGGYAVERPWPLRRWERFRYRFQPNDAVKLARTRFAELGVPDQAASWVGAHNAHYFETYYFGNPGHYQHFVYSINDAGALAWDTPWKDGLRWGFSDEPLDVSLALAKAVAEADSARLGSDDEEVALDDLHEDNEPELEFDVPDEAVLPADVQAFRRRARVNTYTVIGPEFFLDDYPGAEGRLDEYPVIFGVNQHRVRTIG